MVLAGLINRDWVGGKGLLGAPVALEMIEPLVEVSGLYSGASLLACEDRVVAHLRW